MTLEELIGQRIREACQAKGWTQTELGQRLGEVLGRPWTKITVSVAMRGGRRFTAEELWALARTLDRPIAWFYWSDDPEAQVDLLGGIPAVEVYKVAAEKAGVPDVVEVMESVKESLEKLLESERRE
jgi:transcriptional regulator with XRE-family HTH domain